MYESIFYKVLSFFNGYVGLKGKQMTQVDTNERELFDPLVYPEMSTRVLAEPIKSQQLGLQLRLLQEWHTLALGPHLLPFQVISGKMMAEPEAKTRPFHQHCSSGCESAKKSLTCCVVISTPSVTLIVKFPCAFTQFFISVKNTNQANQANKQTRM